MNDFRMKFYQFMQGRYGNDDFKKGIFALIIVFVILGIFGVPYSSRLALVLLILYYFRTFSKNYNKRYEENQKYLKMTEGIRFWWQQTKKQMAYRKTHRIFRCKKCKKKLSVPKGKGKIEISCPCGNHFVKKT